MKKEALISGAELAPISKTLGISSGKGVVSIRTSRSNLIQVSLAKVFFYAIAYLGCRAAIVWL